MQEKNELLFTQKTSSPAVLDALPREHIFPWYEPEFPAEKKLQKNIKKC